MQGRATNLGNVISLLGAFVATAMVMGLLAAGLLIPAVGATGSAATSGVKMFDDLPGEFTTSPLSQQSRILDSKGNVITTPQEENRIIVSLKDVAPIMQEAQIAIEDSRFREHGGVDPRGIARALVSNAQGGGVQGASTLTQQYVKLTLQENALRNNDEAAAKAAVAPTYTRKLQELKYAVTLEKEMTKDQILQGYMNLAYYGDLAYGIEAAAQHYFSVSAKKLTLPQAALLAGLVQNPSKTDPIHNAARAQARRDVVLDRMHDLGKISDKDWKAAKAIPVKKMLKVKQPLSNCAASSQTYVYFCNYVMAYLKTMPELGKTVPERIKNITQGGLTIQTTLNPDTQKMAKQQLTQRVPIGNPEGIGAAASIVEPGTGRVLAMVQNTTYTTGKGSKKKGLTQLNWNVDRAYGGEAGFQFGSTAKMYAIVTALEKGIPVNGSIPSKFATATKPASYSPSEQGRCGDTRNWDVRNDFAAGGKPIPFKKATAQSINTAFASLVLKLGVPNVQKTMTTMGLHTGLGDKIPCGPASVTLGAGTTTPLTLASSYATLAANGKYCPPNPILSITTNDKKPLKLRPSACKQVIDPDIAKGATSLLTNVIKSGTGTGASLGSRPAAGKTGTTDNHYQSWFVGYTPQLATAVWVGTPYNQFRMKNISLAGHYYGEVFGGTISAPVWKAIMQGASEDMPIKQFDDPSNTILNGDLVSVPYVSGMSVDQATQRLKDAGFLVQVAGNTASGLPQGFVVYTDPSGSAVKGSTIGLYLSTGKAKQDKPKPSTSTTKKKGKGPGGGFTFPPPPPSR
jgi:membrane peptidoglycan carboxypeptidase